MGLMDLFKPKWKHSKWVVRKAAVKKLNDQELLADIAKMDEDEIVRQAAVEKLADPALLANVAKTNKESTVRRAAVEKIIDQKLIAEIAKTDEDRWVREAAVKQLTDPVLLADIAMADKEWVVRRAAMKQLPEGTAMKKQLLTNMLDCLCSENQAIDAICRYWRHRASVFWATRPYYRICDGGCLNPEVPHGTGYVWGSDLLCDECGAKALIEASDNPYDYFSVELPRAWEFVKNNADV